MEGFKTMTNNNTTKEVFNLEKIKSDLNDFSQDHYTYKLGDQVLEILRDQDNQHMDPTQDDFRLVKLALFHKRYNFTNDLDIVSGDYDGWDHMLRDIIKRFKPLAILPVYMYEHGGITISTSAFSCPWDSGLLGYALITKEDFKAEGLDKKKHDPKKIIDDFIKYYDRYLTEPSYSYNYNDDGYISGYFDDQLLEELKNSGIAN